MLSRLISDETIPAGRQAVVTRTRSTNWGQLRKAAQRFAGAHQGLRGRRVGLVFPPIAASYAALAALDRLACDVFLLDARSTFEERTRLAAKFKLAALLIPAAGEGSSDYHVHELADEAAGSGHPTVTILTSGSTGEPKAARHTWESLGRPVRENPGDAAPQWLLTYRPHLYAGLQVMLQCFANRGVLVAADLDLDPRAVAQLMSDAKVQFVSATPSFWRRLLMFADADLLKTIPLVQITLGGEVVDQPILDGLRRHFPKARLAHIYATTELGRCFSVTDGVSGFPTAYLDAPLPDGAELRLHEGELLVRCPNGMRMYDPLSNQTPSTADWFATGDLAEIRNGRVYFVGRRSEMINVGGAKVYPLEVERVIRPIPGIADVRVFAKASSIVGEMVGCEIVPAAGQDGESLKREVTRVCQARLASHQQPRLIKIVDQIGVSSAGKTLRGAAA